MKILVTGSAGHLGEALVRTLKSTDHDVVGLDIKPSPFTSVVGSISDRSYVTSGMRGVDIVYHTATLHKPHVATHSRQQFVDTNVSGTLTLLEVAASENVEAFIFTSTTSVFGDALRPPRDSSAVWVTEDTRPIPRNIYGVTKTAAEELCYLFFRTHGLNCVVLRTSRFFPEDDDDRTKRDRYNQDNVKTNEMLFRRVDLEDVVSAHLLASECASAIGFGRYIISATTPFLPDDLAALRVDAPSVVCRRVPDYASVYEQLGWEMFESVDRVYDNSAARRDLNWRPRYDFESTLRRLRRGDTIGSELAQVVGSKGYHDQTFEDGPYPVE